MVLKCEGGMNMKEYRLMGLFKPSNVSYFTSLYQNIVLEWPSGNGTIRWWSYCVIPQATERLYYKDLVE